MSEAWTTWRKSSHSVNDNCVEVAFGSTAVTVRDSKQPAGPQLHLTTGQWLTFVRSYLRFR